MRTNIEIDDRLLHEAQELIGARTKREAVDVALREMVARHRSSVWIDVLNERDSPQAKRCLELIEGGEPAWAVGLGAMRHGNDLDRASRIVYAIDDAVGPTARRMASL
jgi:hypothetical protein